MSCDEHYKGLVPEFSKMSLKPGIGFDWYDKFKFDVYPHDYVVVNGKKCKPPRYYDKKFEKDFPDVFFDVALKREEEAFERSEDNTFDRLLVKEEVASSKLRRLHREFS